MKYPSTNRNGRRDKPDWSARIGFVRNQLPLIAILAIAYGVGVNVHAQLGDVGKKIYEREPFDRITVKSGKQHEILPLSTEILVGRQVPENPSPNKNVRIRLLKDPDKQFGILWKNIKKLETYEMMVLAEAVSVIEKAKSLRRTDPQKLALFDQAYYYFAFLKQKYSKYPPKGMEKEYQRFLYFNAQALHDQEQTLRAFSIYEELYRRNQNYTTKEGGQNEIIPAINEIVGGIANDFIKNKKFGEARDYISNVRRTYGDKLKSLDAAVATMNKLAAVHRDAARKHLAAKRYRDAHNSVRQMISIWPTVQGGKKLIVDVGTQFPQVVVGVDELPLQRKMDHFTNWSARRAGRLVERMLFEARSPGSEGTVYTCPLGRFDSGAREELREFTMKLAPAPLRTDRPAMTGYDLSRELIARTNTTLKQYDQSWTAAFDRVRVSGVVGVEVFFRRPHILPPALMRISLKPRDATSGSFGPYQLTAASPTHHTYAQNPQYGLWKENQSFKPPAEIIERRFVDRSEAIRALKTGQIDVIDRLHPGDVINLRKDKNLVVERYGFPTIHVLIPNLDRPYPAHWAFRKSVAYAIDRQVLLDKAILLDQKGPTLPGCRTISGPFPPGLTETDPLGYGYDEEILPRKRQPRVAIALKLLADSLVTKKAEKNKEPVPKFTGVTIAHPPTDLARTICRLIQQQLNNAKLKCTLKELQPGQSSSTDADIDFTYAELTPWEPLVDARRMLGPNGIAPSGGTKVELALQRLDITRDWEGARDRLKYVHRMAYNDVSMISLVQVSNYFAHHKGVSGIRGGSAWLYENIESWKVDPRVRE